MNWKQDKADKRFFTCEKYFDKYKYVVEIFVEDKNKSSLFWVAVSSGKKRKELEIFQSK